MTTNAEAVESEKKTREHVALWAIDEFFKMDGVDPRARTALLAWAQALDRDLRAPAVPVPDDAPTTPSVLTAFRAVGDALEGLTVVERRRVLMAALIIVS